MTLYFTVQLSLDIINSFINLKIKTILWAFCFSYGHHISRMTCTSPSMTTGHVGLSSVPAVSPRENANKTRRVGLCLIHAHSSVSFSLAAPPGCLLLSFHPFPLVRRQLRVEFLPQPHMRKWNRLKCEFVLWRRSINGNGKEGVFKGWGSVGWGPVRKLSALVRVQRTLHIELFSAGAWILIKLVHFLALLPVEKSDRMELAFFVLSFVFMF